MNKKKALQKSQAKHKSAGKPAKERCDKTIDAFSNVMDAKQIKAIIKERGWTQKEIAEYWGMTPNWIYLLIKNEDGKRSVRDDCAFMGLPKK